MAAKPPATTSGCCRKVFSGNRTFDKELHHQHAVADVRATFRQEWIAAA
jgi:hypothetical protein